MREILFRGKRKDNGEWIYGYLVNGSDWLTGESITAIIETDALFYPRNEIVSYEIVDPKTVGQWTGMYDKNNVKIFEGDIMSTRKTGTTIKKLKGYYGYDSDGYPQKIPGYEGESEYRYTCEKDSLAKVVFNPCTGGFYLIGGDKAINAICNEVVGNIHDNPELLT